MKLSNACGLNFIGPVQFLNGLGVSARSYVNAITHANIPLNVIPWRYGFEHLSCVKNDFPGNDLQPVNVVHLNLDLLFTQDLLNKKPLISLMKSSAYNICIPYWELMAVDPRWVHIIEAFDEIWCPSTFIYRAISAVTTKKLRLIRPALNLYRTISQLGRNSFSLPSNRFIFFFSADFNSVIGRKNPRFLLDAYINSFRENEGACCVIKINHANNYNADISYIKKVAARRMDVIYLSEELTDELMHALYSCIDCYVSPHRSEGLGLTILEAMSLSKPVIATSFGGPEDFISKEYAFELDYRFIEVGPRNEPYGSGFIWADPIMESLCHNLRRVFYDQVLAAEIGACGREHVDKIYSIENSSASITTALHDIEKKIGISS